MNKTKEAKSVLFEMGEFVDNENDESLITLFSENQKKDNELKHKRKREKNESNSEKEDFKEKNKLKKKKNHSHSHRHHHKHKHSSSKKNRNSKNNIKIKNYKNKESENEQKEKKQNINENFKNIINEIDNLELKNNENKNLKEHKIANSENNAKEENENKNIKNKKVNKKIFNIDKKTEYDFSNMTLKDINWLPVNPSEKITNTNLFYSNQDNCKLTHREINLPQDFPKEAKPIDYLYLFYTEELWNHITTQTNKFAEAKIDSYNINFEIDSNKKEGIPNFKVKNNIYNKNYINNDKNKNKNEESYIRKINENIQEECDIIDYVDEDFVEHDDKGNIMEEINDNDINENENNDLKNIIDSQTYFIPKIKFRRGKKKGPITQRQIYLEEKNDRINNEDILIQDEENSAFSDISYEDEDNLYEYDNNELSKDISNETTNNTLLINNERNTQIKNSNKSILIQKETRFYNYSKWKYTTKEEIKLFHGLILWMGIHSNKDYKDNWSNDYIYASNISKFMSRNRFMMLSTFLHLDDIKKDTKTDKIFKVRYVLNYLNNRFSALYKPSKFICIDECMIKLSPTNEYKETLLRKKNEHQGIKALLLCDNYTYYCMEMILDTGKNNEYRMFNDKLISNNHNNLTNNENIIISLLRNITKLNSKHILYMDSKYTSYKICEYCRLNNIGFIGLIKREKVNIKDEENLIIPGNEYQPSIKKKYAFYIDSKKNMTLTLIRDSNNYEYLLSNVTIPCLVRFDKNNCIKNKSKPNNLIDSKFFDMMEIPNLVKNYSERTKSVVLCNIRTKAYHYPHKNFKWWKSIYYHIFHLCINNAYALYRINNGKMVFKDFYYHIVKSLIGDEPKIKKNKVHALIYINPQLKSKRRLFCRYCKRKKTEYMCPDCSTPNSTAALCVIDCFKKFHENGGKPAPESVYPVYVGPKIINVDINGNILENEKENDNNENNENQK